MRMSSYINNIFIESIIILIILYIESSFKKMTMMKNMTKNDADDKVAKAIIYNINKDNFIYYLMNN